ncbi:MAG: hypothetical protein HY908_14280 [Myxococcales bacterium]|nr:hypothetical protein [Myxococcales bacterium]
MDRLGLSLFLAGALLAANACTLSRSGTAPEPGAGGTTVTSSSTTTSSTTSSTTGTGGSGAEDCLNGIDDDENGTTDCADPACSPTEYDCIPDAGSVAYVSPAGGGCDADLTELTTYDCSSCGCTPIPGDCTLAVTLFDNQASCNGSSAGPYAAGTSCNDVADFNLGSSETVHFIASKTPGADPGCAPTAPTATAASVGLCQTTRKGLGCAQSSGGQSQICVPARPEWCVLVAGPTCPAGYDAAPPHVVYDQGAAPTCTCGCEVLGQAACGPATLRFSDGNSCGNTFQDVLVAPGCQDTTLRNVHSLQATAVVENTALCSASGDTAAGVERLLCCAAGAP